MTRGYLRDSGGAKRLRFVKPGYDADSESVPANAVLFDSGDPGALHIYKAGTWTGTIPSETGAFIVTWPSLGYTPLATIQSQFSGKMYPTSFWSYPSVSLPRFSVYPTGLYLENGRPIAPDSTTYSISYQIYRLQVQ